VLRAFKLDPIKGILREFSQSGKVEIPIPVDASPQFVQPSLIRDGRMCVVTKDVQPREVVWDLQSAVFPLEELALIRLQLVFESFSPLRHGSGIVLRYLAEVGAKASLCCLAGRLRATPRYALRYIVATAHQGDQNHAFAIQSRGSIFSLDCIVYVDVCRSLPCLLWRPVSDCDAASKHERVHIFTQDRIHYAFALQQGALCLSLARRKVYRVSKLLQQLLGEKFGDGSDIRTGALIAFEGWLVGSVENEDGMDSEGDEAKKTVVEGAQRWVCAAWSLSE
jgi:hypothetical protein